MKTTSTRLSLESLEAREVPANVTTATFTDTFTRANSASVGDYWTDRAGDFQVQGSQAASIASSGTGVTTLNGVSQRDMAVQAYVNIAAGSGKSASLIARYSGPGDSNYYMAEAYSEAGSASSTIRLYRNHGGTFSKLAEFSTAGGITGTLRFEAVDSSFKAFLNSELKAFAHDTLLNGAGSAGMRATGGGTLDTFSYATAAPSLATLTFNDAFASATRAQLGASYLSRMGNFRVAGGTASNNADGTSVALLNSASTANVTVRADINMAYGSEKSFGLLARVNGTGEGTSGYLAEVNALPGIGNKVRVSLFRNDGGRYFAVYAADTTLNTGTFTFTAASSTLSVSMGSTNIFSVTDTTYEAGLAGVRVNGKAGTVSFDNLNVSVAPAPTRRPPAAPVVNQNVAVPVAIGPGGGGIGPRGHDTDLALLARDLGGVFTRDLALSQVSRVPAIGVSVLSPTISRVPTAMTDTIFALEPTLRTPFRMF